VVDVRVHEDRAVLDVRLTVGELAVWLPGPGPASSEWGATAEPSHGVILRLPTRSTSWLRAAPAVTWLAIVADQPLSAVDGQAGPPLVLDHRTHGAVALLYDGLAVSLRADRCPGGNDCVVEP
jgi:hypothetical protein